MFTKDDWNNFPRGLTNVSYCAKALAGPAILTLQHDLVEAIQCLFMLEKSHKQSLALGEGGSSINISVSGRRNTIIWFDFPNVLKALIAIITAMFTSFVTLKATDIMDLLKDFAALVIINEIDNHVFAVYMENGFFGMSNNSTKKQAHEVKTRCVRIDVTQAPRIRTFRKDKFIFVVCFIKNNKCIN